VVEFAKLSPLSVSLRSGKGVIQSERKRNAASVIPDNAAVLLLSVCGALPVPYEPLFVSATFAAVGVTLVGGEVTRLKLRLPASALILLAWMCASLLWASTPIESGVAVAKAVIFAGIATVICADRTPEQVRDLVCACGRWLLGLSWAMVILVPARGLTTDSYELGTVRGVFLQRNQFGFMALLFGVAFASRVIQQYDKQLLSRKWDVAWFLLALTSLAMSASRTGWLVGSAALAVGTVLCVIAKMDIDLRTISMGTAGAMLLMASPFVVSNYAVAAKAVGRDADLTGRTRAWPAIIRAIQQHAWQGYGWGDVWPASEVAREVRVYAGFDIANSHNAYLDMALQTGIVGAGLAVAVLAAILRISSHDFAGRPGAANAWVLVTIICLIGYGFTESLTFGNFGVTLMFLLAASASKMRQNHERQLRRNT
jgi:O-antigen ligase